MITCRCSQLRVASSFSSFPDYDTHKKVVLDSELFDDEPVAQHYGGVGGLAENWFKCKTCGEVWRLVEPDPPFKGMWCPVAPPASV